jgi:hypothetical protein
VSLGWGTSIDCPPDLFEPAGTVCRPSTAACDVAESCTGTSASCPPDAPVEDSDGDGVCDAVDDCPDGDATDSDGDGIADACDPCSNVVPVFASKARIKIRNLATPLGDDRLNFRGIVVVPTMPAIDPATKGVRILLGGAAGPTMLDAIIPGGAGWRTNSAHTAWRFRSKTEVHGIVKVTLKSRTSRPGMLRFTVVGKKGSYPVAQDEMPMKGTIVIDSPIARTGQCGEAVFPGPSPIPHCAFNATGNAMLCK